MPCIYDDFGQSERDMRKHLDLTTRLLCSTCEALDGTAEGGKLLGNTELGRWWASHRAADRKREEREQERKRLELEHEEQRVKFAEIELATRKRNLQEKKEALRVNA